MREKPLTEFLNSKNPVKKPKKKSTESKGLKGPWELPEGWRWVRLGEVAEIIMGQSPPSDSYNTEGIGLPFYQGSKDFGTIHPTPRVWCTNPQKLAKKGDILISVRAPVGPVNIAIEKCIIGRGLAAIRPLKVERMFLFYFLKSFEDKWIGFGSTFDAIRKKELQNLPIPLPPLSEQKRIVAKLDETSRRLEEAKRLAREAREEAEKLMASALHEVFSKAEERGWEWAKIKDITTDTERVNPTETPDLEFWYIDIASIDNSTYQISKPKLLKGKEAPSRARKLVKAGDVIFATTRPYLRNIAIVPDWLDNQVCSTGFAVLRTIPEKTIPKWIFYYLISDFAIEQIKPMMRGANYPAITDRDLFNLKIPLPPLEEQKRIVAYLDSISERVQKLVKLYEERERELERLFPAILDRAFRGEL